MSRWIPQISYSLLASLNAGIPLPEALGRLNDIGVDMVHYDVSDEPKTLRLQDLEMLRHYTALPFDVHLAVSDPVAQSANLRMLTGDFFCVHVENKLSRSDLSELKEQLGCHFGLAINPATPVDALFDFADEIDYAMFMAAQAGVSGGSFDETVVEKIGAFRRKCPSVRIHVDGGINNFTASVVRQAGVDAMVSGSYILKNTDHARQVAALVGQNLNLTVDTFMYAGDDLPRVAPRLPIRAVASEVDRYGIGCVCVVGAGAELLGIITDTDIRKFVIRNNDHLSLTTAEDVMNRRPYTVRGGVPIIRLIRQLENHGKFFTIVPVVTEDDRLMGIVRLQDILFANGTSIRFSN